ncbi:hypothetical protein HG535_0C02400 [Zygotorulaspora mrakii]|uniref:Protein DSF2 n=1 Tax=Zygotorulaspora mrakii TaxID=42260 RepID=A0A7H9AZU7_ZYGMR|nr:uncharacterized protein HG535_0C02400 [Zygotorulaspora mrakii]QLG71890.1 hypothetical protein HG535_0C02400 [Zygotorulaspora mrakii]
MNLDLSKASPLDELRNRSGYFPSLSCANEIVDNADNSWTNQDDSNSIYQGTNQSIFSFETIQTNERLLDRLALSAEDELFLQQALKEEEEKNKDCLKKQSTGPIICMPASKFPSLRTQYPPIKKEHDLKLDHVSAEFSNLRGDFSSSSVEQHFPANSRYSYLVEEDIDIEAIHRSNFTGRGSDRQQHPYRPKIIASNSAGNCNNSGDADVVNFERYRMKNSKLAYYYEQLSQFNFEHTGEHESSSMYKTPRNQYYEIKTPVITEEQTYQNVSGSSTASFADEGILSKPKTESSMESDISSKGIFNTQDGSRDLFYSTPTKTSSSPTVESEFVKDVSREPPQLFKTHKKKSSFSLKNLFRSPKSHKQKGTSEGRGSFEETKNIHYHGRSSAESSPRKPRNHLRHFIFPVNPTIHLETQTPTKYKHGNKNSSRHFRSLSDFTTKSPSCSPSTNRGGYNGRKETTGRRLSLDSKRQPFPPLQFQTPAHSKKPSKNALQLSLKSDYISTIAAGPANNASSTFDEIELAITMKKEGRLIESAQNLQRLCSKKNLTAFLLYGLALRDGCGVRKDCKESFKYIKVAAEVHSEKEDVFEKDIDVFALEHSRGLPKIVPEPMAPALYECGMAYLKGLGLEKPDELKGLKYLEKAASLGHIDSMCISGTIWSKKSAVRKRDIVRAAAWFRIAEQRGANLIGSSWIHKEKYVNPLLSITTM